MMGMPLLVSSIVTLFVNLIVFSAVPFADGLPGVRPDNFEVFVWNHLTGWEKSGILTLLC